MEDRGWSQNNPWLETEGFCWRAPEVNVLIRHSGAGRNPGLIVTWIPSRIAVRDKLSNGMTDAVRHLDAGLRRHDEPSLRLKHVLSIVEVASNLSHPQRDFNEEGLWN